MTSERIERQLERLEKRLDINSNDTSYARGRLDEIAIAVAHIPNLVEKQRRIKNSVRHVWLAVLVTLASAGVALARTFL
jgi:hypothetical protein